MAVRNGFKAALTCPIAVGHAEKRTPGGCGRVLLLSEPTQHQVPVVADVAPPVGSIWKTRQCR